MAVDDSILVRCTRCKSKFRDKARRIRDGYSRQCPSCESMVFFMEGSANRDIHEAMREAERVRKALRQEEAERVFKRAPAPAAEQNDEDEHAPAMPSRRIERRAGPRGRVE
jgi:hypothetical protein